MVGPNKSQTPISGIPRPFKRGDSGFEDYDQNPVQNPVWFQNPLPELQQSTSWDNHVLSSKCKISAQKNHQNPFDTTYYNTLRNKCFLSSH